MDLRSKRVVVTGGSRGLGLGLVEALVTQGANVTVVARGVDDLQAVRTRLGVDTVSADVTDAAAARQVLSDARPDVLVLNAGAKPPMARLDMMHWHDFSATWEADVKAGFHWLQAALTLPLSRGSRVLVGSSGAALNGSPLSGGYAGAKRMLWVMARYANGVSEQADLGIRFQVIVPQQTVSGAGVGDAGAKAYAGALGIPMAQFLARFGAPMPPTEFCEKVVRILNQPQYATGMAFGLKGDTDITILEEASA